MKTVIMAGGRGVRISSLFPTTPKPLIPINGIPVLEREIKLLHDQGFRDIIITVGYLKNKIMDYFGNGDRIDVNIKYFTEEIPLGNAGALIKMRAENILQGDFLLLNADSIFDIDFRRFEYYHKQKNGLVTLFTHPNSHPFDSSLIIADNNNCVTQWLTKEDERPRWYKNRVNAGLHIINASILDRYIPLANELGKIDDGGIETNKIDLDRDVLRPLCGTGEMFCYDSPEYVKDMGTPERYEKVCDDCKKGVIKYKNLQYKQKAVFFDRDGTINKYVGFLTNIEQFQMLPGVAETIKEINDLGYLVIVVTNQPVISRGEVTVNELNNIHNKMETLLGEEGAYLDAIYYCPHHPDKGYDNEIKELKIECECRKPKPGMLIRAAKDYNINLSQSWMIGDEEKDIIAGKRAGCKTVYIDRNNNGCAYGQNLTVKSMVELKGKIHEFLA